MIADVLICILYILYFKDELVEWVRKFKKVQAKKTHETK